MTLGNCIRRRQFSMTTLTLLLLAIVFALEVAWLLRV